MRLGLVALVSDDYVPGGRCQQCTNAAVESIRLRVISEDVEPGVRWGSCTT